jgi:FtsP/CotA-like multicopper oxidase with cupredoxin domain
MSRNRRIALAALAVAVAVVAFVIAKPGGDSGDKASTDTGTAPKTTGTAQAAPAVERIQIKGGKPVGGAGTIKVKKGDRVRIVVSADAPDDIHLHGYDIEKKSRPGHPATFAFDAKVEGVFEMESHTAEHEGLEPLVAKLVVEP